MYRKVRRVIVETVKKALYNRNNISPRKRYSHKDLLVKLNSIPIKEVNDIQKSKIKNFWSQYSNKFDYRWFDFFNTIAPEADHLEHYIPHDLYYCIIDPYYSDIQKSRFFDNKNMYDLYFHDVTQPKTIARIINNNILDEKYQFINIEEAITKCENEQNIIIKPSIDSEGGSGIRFWSRSIDSKDELKRLFEGGGNFIIQAIIKQCNELSKIHSNSLNTIRVITLIHDNEVLPLSSTLRMGVGGAKVDNAASGGIFCGINSDGTLKNYAFDSKGNKYTEHPQSGAFSNNKIPNFEKCINLVKMLAPRVAHISKLCSWDLCVDHTNMPVLIEVNLSFGDIQLHQVVNGPIFGNLTPVILNEILKK